MTMSASFQLANVPPLRLFHREVTATGETSFLESLFFRGAAASDSGQATDGLFMLIFWFSVAFFVLLMVLMFYWAFFKYRRRPGVPPPRSPAHNTTLELIWTIVPSSALIVIFFLGFTAYMDAQVPSQDAYEIEIKGKQWAWTPTYHNGASTQWYLPTDQRTNPVTNVTYKNTQDSPVIIVPEDTRIKLRMSSADVIHSFWIPDLRLKADVFPNRYTGFSFTTPKLEPGEPYQDHWVFCAEYCGDQHSEMAAIMRVMPKSDFDQTLSGWTGPLSGEQIAQQQGCFACHGVDQAKTGPAWNDLYGYPGAFEDGTRIERKDANYIRESILYPDRKHVEGYPGGMNSYQGLISEEELDTLVRYIINQSDRAPETPGEAGGGASREDGGEDADAEQEGAPQEEEAGQQEAGGGMQARTG